VAGARFCLGLNAVVFSLLGYFFGMITVFTAVLGVMIGLFNISTSERVRHYPRPVVDRTVTSTNREPRLFMVVPETKDGSTAKHIVVEKADAKKSKPHKPRVLARQRNNYEGRGYGNALGYAQEFRNDPRSFFIH
jgi:hypothetical protein